MTASASATAPGTTRRLSIRLLERRDIEAARVLHNDDSTLRNLTDITHVSELQQEGWFQSVSTSRSSRRYVARRLDDDTFVGVFRVDRLDPWNRSAYIGADVAREKRGQGYASEMYGYFLEYLFDHCGMHRLGLETMASNATALGLYLKLGFREEGRSREAIFRHGRFHDLVMMGLLEHEWRALAHKTP
jgi:RimJ/RimL family protein N-acetyltransferase